MSLIIRLPAEFRHYFPLIRGIDNLTDHAKPPLLLWGKKPHPFCR